MFSNINFNMDQTLSFCQLSSTNGFSICEAINIFFAFDKLLKLFRMTLNAKRNICLKEANIIKLNEIF